MILDSAFFRGGLVVSRWLRQFIGTHSQKELARGERLLAEVERHGAMLSELGETELQNRARAMGDRALAGEAPAQLAAETFALVREVSTRLLGMRHYDVQIVAGIALRAATSPR
jgi:preprotein translocase subunit SecA